MNTELFIRRAVTTTLLMLAILLFGSVGYRLLPVSDLPNVDFPVLQVTASLPGASPETMASSVATPLERQFSTIEGLATMTSTNTLGSTQVILQFDLERDLDVAAQDVQTAITQATPFLPQNLPQPPTYRKVNPADQPILYFALTSATMRLSDLNEYADTLMAQRMSMVRGVAQVQIFGPQKYAVRVQLNPHELASKRIGLDEVEQALNDENVDLPTGTLYGSEKAYTVLADGQLFEASAYRPLIVAYRNGAPVRLRELARVIDGVENDKSAAWYGELGKLQRGIVLAVQRQPGTNTVEVANSVKALMPILQSYLPRSVELHVLYDRSQSISESIHEVELTIYLTLFLVVGVIFLFLRNVSATLIPSLALPMSLVGTFALMYQLGYTLDNLSLMALILAIGFVVDDAIVMLENIVRHLEMGKGPFQAAVDGAREITFTIVSMTLSLAAVFIPVLFMGGVVGRLFREFGVTIFTAIIISGIVSLTLTPMLCSRFLRAPSEEKHGRLYNATERMFEAMARVYDGSLRWVLAHRPFTLAVSFVILVVTGYLFLVIPKGFLPNQDQGTILVNTEAAEGISFEKMMQLQQEVMKVVGKNPHVRSFYSSVGARGNTSLGMNQGVMFLHLEKEREVTSQQVIEQLRPELSKVVGMRTYLQDPPEIRLTGQLTKSPYQFILQNPSVEQLYHYAPILEEKLKETAGLEDVTSDLQIKNPQLNVDIDRDKAATLGVSARQIESALYSAYGDNWVSTIFAPNDQYKVIMEVAPEYQDRPEVLSMLYVRSHDSELVRLDSLASFHENVGPLSVNHNGQFPAVAISFNIKPGVSLSEAVERINLAVAETLPAGFTTSFTGTAEEFQKSIGSLGLLLLFSILVIYLILGILYESFIHPLTILSGLPSAGLGALLTLLLFGVELDIYGFVGLIMLIGIVKKNAIMQIDFALAAEKHDRLSPAEAIYRGCLVRFRPIMMTTGAALFGVLPIAIGLGGGGASRRPLGLAVVGGLLFSQLITLFLTPVVYVYLDRLQHKLSGLTIFQVRRQLPESAADQV